MTNNENHNRKRTPANLIITHLFQKVYTQKFILQG
nr:MAG TPA: hypothetical protein [Caudoviricetes sp.]